MQAKIREQGHRQRPMLLPHWFSQISQPRERAIDLLEASDGILGREILPSKHTRICYQNAQQRHKIGMSRAKVAQSAQQGIPHIQMQHPLERRFIHLLPFEIATHQPPNWPGKTPLLHMVLGAAQTLSTWRVEQNHRQVFRLVGKQAHRKTLSTTCLYQRLPDALWIINWRKKIACRWLQFLYWHTIDFTVALEECGIGEPAGVNHCKPPRLEQRQRLCYPLLVVIVENATGILVQIFWKS